MRDTGVTALTLLVPLVLVAGRRSMGAVMAVRARRGHAGHGNHREGPRETCCRQASGEELEREGTAAPAHQAPNFFA